MSHFFILILVSSSQTRSHIHSHIFSQMQRQKPATFALFSLALRTILLRFKQSIRCMFCAVWQVHRCLANDCQPFAFELTRTKWLLSSKQTCNYRHCRSYQPVDSIQKNYKHLLFASAFHHAHLMNSRNITSRITHQLTFFILSLNLILSQLVWDVQTNSIQCKSRATDLKQTCRSQCICSEDNSHSQMDGNANEREKAD